MAGENTIILRVILLIFCINAASIWSGRGKPLFQGLYTSIKLLDIEQGVSPFRNRRQTYRFKKAHLFSGHSFERLKYEVDKTEMEGQILAVLPPKVRKNAESIVRATLVLCEKYQLDPYWVIAIIWTESHFKISARSWVGAKGLMQLMPRTRQYIKQKMNKQGISLEAHKEQIHSRSPAFKQLRADIDNFQHVLENLEIGIYYLKRLNLRFKNPTYATVAYNMGPTWVWRSLKRNKVVGSSRNNYLNKVKKRYEALVGLSPDSSSYRL